MDLFDATEKVKNALSSKDYIASLTHFHLKNGEIFASNGAMTASCPINEALEHVVPADELTKALTMFGKDASYEWTAETLTVKKGRRKMTVRLLQPDLVSFIEPVPVSFVVGDGFIQRMQRIRPFLSDDASRPWALTAWLHINSKGDLVWTATNNIAVVEVNAVNTDCMQEDTNEINCQIPNFALDFVIDRKSGLTGLGIAENKVTFYFADSSKMTTQLFVQKMPEQVSNILQDLYDTHGAMFELKPEWKQAYRDIIELGPDEIMLSSNLMSAGRKQATIEIEIDTQPPQDTSKIASVYHPKFLTPVVQEAKYIDFGAYPKPAAFFGDGIRGLIAGKVM